MAIRSSYDSKINKLMQVKPIILEIEKAMLHGEVHRFSDEILFVSDDFTEVPPFIHPIYSPEKDIAFIDVRGFSSVGKDGALTLKGDVDSELTLLRAKLELVWQRAPRADVFTAFHFSNLIFVRWLADTICHKQGLQLGQKSKVLAVTGLYLIGLYYNNVTDDYQINKYAEMISRDFYIPLEEVFGVIDTLDNPFPRDVDEYVEALKKMQISPRLANLNTVSLYSMLGGSWFMTANAIQLVGLAVEYPPCFAAMVSVATRYKIFKKTQIGERVDRANKGSAYDHFARALNAVINNNLGQINPNRQRAGMESIPYNTMMLDDFDEQSFGMEASGKQIAGMVVGGGLIAAIIAWIWQKFSGGSSGGGGGSGGSVVEKTEAKVEATVKAKESIKEKKAEAKVLASEIVSDARTNAEAMDDLIVQDVAKAVEASGDKKVETIVARSHNRVAAPLINIAVKYAPSQEPTNHWANMEALVRSFEHIEDPIRLAAIFEVYKRALRGGDQNVRGVIADFIKHPLFKRDAVVCGALFCAGRFYHVPNDEQSAFAANLLEIYTPEVVNDVLAMSDVVTEAREDIEAGMSSSDLDIKYGMRINRIYMALWDSPAQQWIKSGANAEELMAACREGIAAKWTEGAYDTFENFDGSPKYVETLLEAIFEFRSEYTKNYLEWLKQLESVTKATTPRTEKLDAAGGSDLWKHFGEHNVEMMKTIDSAFRAGLFGITQTLRIHQGAANGVSHIVESVDKFQGLVNENLEAAKRELKRAGKKAGMESYEELEGEFLPAEKGVGMEVNVWADVAARVGIAVLVGMFVEWLVRKLTGSSGGGGGGGYRSTITFRVETASEALVRVGDKLTKTKADFLAFNSEINRRKLTDEQLSSLVKTDADRIVLRKFLGAIANDDHLLRAFAVLIVNGASGKDESQFTFLGVSATDRDWDKWVITALNNFRKTTMPNDMEFEKYLLFCGMSIPGTFAIADVIESIDITKALQKIEIETEIVEEIFKIGDGFDDASAKRIADEIRKGASGPASSSREVAIPGAAGKTYREIFDTARTTRFSIWPGTIFRAGLKDDETLAVIKPDQWRTILDTKRLSTKLEADKNTLKRMEDKAKAMSKSLNAASATAKLGSRYSSNPEDHQVISDFLSKKSEAMAEIQAYLQAVNSYTQGVEHQTSHMSVACNTLNARIGNVKTLLNKVD